jgi:hypothetical protein
MRYGKASKQMYRHSRMNRRQNWMIAWCAIKTILLNVIPWEQVKAAVFKKNSDIAGCLVSSGECGAEGRAVAIRKCEA